MNAPNIYAIRQRAGRTQQQFADALGHSAKYFAELGAAAKATFRSRSRFVALD